MKSDFSDDASFPLELHAVSTTRTKSITAATAAPRGARTSGVEVEVEHLDRVETADAVDLFLREILHDLLGDLLGVRPGGVAVRVVGLERHVVHADRVDVLQPVRIV